LQEILASLPIDPVPHLAGFKGWIYHSPNLYRLRYRPGFHSTVIKEDCHETSHRSSDCDSICPGGLYVLTIPDNDLLDLAGDFSISFFIKGNSASDHEWLIITKHQAGVCQPAATSWMLRYSQDFGLRLVNYDTSVDCGKTILSAPNVDLLDDEWHLVVIVHDTETNAIALYVDGLLVEEADASRLNIQNNDVPLVIGNQTNGVPQHTLDAVIDDLRIYHRAIEEDVIQALYAEAQ
jgi:hypothetical protein